jgi:hypothetical protein
MIDRFETLAAEQRRVERRRRFNRVWVIVFLCVVAADYACFWRRGSETQQRVVSTDKKKGKIRM